MDNKLIEKSKRSYTNTGIIVLGIVMISVFIIMINETFIPRVIYEEHSKLFFILTLVLLNFYCIYYYFNIRQVYVYDTYFEIKRLFSKKTYHYKDIKTYYSEFIKGKHNSWTEYYLFLKNDKKITLLDSEYSNFSNFFYHIQKRIKEDKSLNTKLSKPKFLKYSIICFGISAFLFYCSSFFYESKEEKKNTLVYFSEILNEDIQLIKGDKGKKHLEIHLKNQPNFDFKISGEAYKNLDITDLLDEYKTESKITLGIEKEEYNKKIAKTQALTFLDKYLHYTTIFVKQIKDADGYEYIDIDKVNDKKISNEYYGIVFFFSIIALFFLYLSIGNYRAHLKDINNINNNRKELTTD